MPTLLGILMVSLLSNTSMGASQFGKLELRHGKTAIESVRYIPDGKQFVSASFDGTVVMWNVRSGKRVWQHDLDEGSKSKNRYTISHILGMDLSPDGRTIAISYFQSLVVGDTVRGKDQYRIALLDSNNGQQIRNLTGHTFLIGQIAFSPNGELLLSESGDLSARLWKVRDGTEVLAIKLKEKGAA